MSEVIALAADWSLQTAQHGAHGPGAPGFGSIWALLVIGLIVVLVASVVSARSTQCNGADRVPEKTRAIDRQQENRDERERDAS